MEQESSLRLVQPSNGEAMVAWTTVVGGSTAVAGGQVATCFVRRDDRICCPMKHGRDKEKDGKESEYF